MTLAHTFTFLICVVGALGSKPAYAQAPAPAQESGTTTESATTPTESATTPAAPDEAGVPVPPPSAPAPASPTPTPPAAATGEAAPAAPASPSPPGFDWGGRQVEPLPPPPAAADPSRISRDPWRGRLWLAIRLTMTGPIGGDKPARPTLLTVGGGAEFGVRLNNRFGLGMGLSGQTHTSVRTTLPGSFDKTIVRGGMFFWDPLFVRVYFLKKRFQPLMEVGVGYARAKLPLSGIVHGTQVRAGLGFEAWVSQNATIGFTTVYRMIALHMPQDGITLARWEVGHAMQGVLQLGLHW